MLEQYKKTFFATQLIVAIVTLFILFKTHRMWLVTAVFFLAMQVGGLVGAMWAARLRRKLEAARTC